MLDKIIIKEVVESNELHKQTPLYLNGGFGKEVEVRRWHYYITDIQDRLWTLGCGFGMNKPILHKDLHRNQELYGEFGLSLHPEDKYAGMIKNRLTKKEFDDKVEKKIACMKAIMADNQKEVERLESLK